MKKTNNSKIRVLVVDDSALMRKKLSEMINADEACEVIATARNGEEALRGVESFHPDVVTLDVELPKMDGLTALKYIMSEWPTPVVMVTAYSNYRGEDTIKCLEYGAVDLVEKPSGVISLDIEKVASELVSKIKVASHVRPKVLRPLLYEKRPSEKKEITQAAKKVVVIASSTGGPRALEEILVNLKPDLPAGVLIIQHMPGGFTQAMAERLNALAAISVSEAKSGDFLMTGKVLIAPGNFDLIIERGSKRDPTLKLIPFHDGEGASPCADVTMKSMAPVYREHCLGIILTGMGQDGVEGLRAIKQFGGRTIAEDESTSIVYGMPKAARESGVADEVLPLNEMPDAITRWAGVERRRK